MKTKLLAPLLLLCITFTAGCGQSTLDGSSQAAFNASVQSIKDSLGDEEKSKFAGALQIINSHYNVRQKLGMPIQGEAKTFLEAVDGKSYDEILELAQTLKQQAGRP